MQTLGWAVIAAGLADVLVARFVVGPRLTNPNQRRLVQGALISGGIIIAIVGVALVTGVFGSGEPVGR